MDDQKRTCSSCLLHFHPGQWQPGLKALFPPLMISTLVWNMRGIGSISTVRRLKKLVSLHSIYLVIISEPLVTQSAIPEISRKLGFPGYATSDNNKVWIFWRHNLTLHVIAQSDQFLHCFLKHPSLSTDIYVTGIYALCTRSGRRLIWDDLLSLQQSCSILGCWEGILTVFSRQMNL